MKRSRKGSHFPGMAFTWEAIGVSRASSLRKQPLEPNISAAGMSGGRRALSAQYDIGPRFPPLSPLSTQSCIVSNAGRLGRIYPDCSSSSVIMLNSCNSSTNATNSNSLAISTSATASGIHPNFSLDPPSFEAEMSHSSTP